MQSKLNPIKNNRTLAAKYLVTCTIAGLVLFAYVGRKYSWKIQEAMLQYQYDTIASAEDAKMDEKSPQPVTHRELELYLKLLKLRLEHDPAFAAEHQKRAQERKKRAEASRAALAALAITHDLESGRLPTVLGSSSATEVAESSSGRNGASTASTPASTLDPILTIDPSTQAVDAGFARVQLNPELSMLIPSSWKAFGRDLNELVSQSALSKTNAVNSLTEVTTERTTLLRIRCVPLTFYASLTVNAFHEQHLSPSEAREMMAEPHGLEAIADVLQNELRAYKDLCHIKGVKTEAVEVSGFPAVRITYQRSDFTNPRPVEVVVLRVYAESRTYSFTWSFRLSQQEILKPILEQSVRSIQFRH